MARQLWSDNLLFHAIPDGDSDSTDFSPATLNTPPTNGSTRASLCIGPWTRLAFISDLEVDCPETDAPVVLQQLQFMACAARIPVDLRPPVCSAHLQRREHNSDFFEKRQQAVCVGEKCTDFARAPVILVCDLIVAHKTAQDGV